jgi:hypothetical protein
MAEYDQLWQNLPHYSQFHPIFGKIRQVLLYVAHYSKNGEKCLKMAYSDVIWSLIATYGHMFGPELTVLRIIVNVCQV